MINKDKNTDNLKEKKDRDYGKLQIDKQISMNSNTPNSRSAYTSAKMTPKR